MGGARVAKGANLREFAVTMSRCERINAGANSSRCGVAARCESRQDEEEVDRAVAQLSGQPVEICAELITSCPSVFSPWTRARRGVQQQWPSRTQQDIEQTSEDVAAIATGANRPLRKTNKTAAARNRRRGVL